MGGKWGKELLQFYIDLQHGVCDHFIHLKMCEQNKNECCLRKCLTYLYLMKNYHKTCV